MFAGLEAFFGYFIMKTHRGCDYDCIDFRIVDYVIKFGGGFEPRIERLLSEVRADNFVLIGASAEGAVKAMALGLLQRGKKVSVVVDAVGLLNKREAKLALRKMGAKGAKLTETKKLAGVSHLRQVGICNCES